MAADQPQPRRRGLALGGLAIMLCAVIVSPARSQRVQIPGTAADAFSAAPPVATFDPYAFGAPSTAGVSPPFAQPLLGAQTVAQPQPLLAAPAPQGFAASNPLFGAPAATPAASSPLFSNSPVQWQRGTYAWQRNDAAAETFTRFLAELSIENGYLFGETDDPDDLEVNELDIHATFTYPLGQNPETPLLITPGFAFNFFEGPIADPAAAPRGPDLPGVVYDAYLDASWFPQPLPAFGADLGLRVGVFSDFDAVNSDSIRVLGRGLGVVKVGPTLDLVFGVVFLDRIDISLLPAGGFHYRPNDLWDFYAVFPSPRATRRLAPAGEVQLNWFFSGEYGGGSWTADRAGLSDRFDYNDIRITTGIEWESPRGRRGSFEIGYVFDRELVFASNAPTTANLDDTFLIRAGIDL